jgi:hypothetical protein
MTTTQAAELRVKWKQQSNPSTCEHLNLELEWSEGRLSNWKLQLPCVRRECGEDMRTVLRASSRYSENLLYSTAASWRPPESVHTIPVIGLRTIYYASSR